MSEPLEVGGSHVFLSIAFETHGEIFPDHPKDIRFLETLHGSAGQRDDEEQNGGNHSHEIKEEGADGRPRQGFTTFASFTIRFSSGYDQFQGFLTGQKMVQFSLNGA